MIKASLPLILGIFVVLLFGLVIAGMFLYKPLMKIWRPEERKDGSIHIRDDFKDGKLHADFATDSAGNCKISEDGKAGLFKIDMGRSTYDAGIVYLKEPLDVSKPITIRHRCRVRNAGGIYQWNPIEIKQNSVQPECTDLSSLLNTQRIWILMRSNGDLSLAYMKSERNLLCGWWSHETGRWITVSRNEPPVNRAFSSFHLFEFHSDGSKWYFVVRDESGKVIMKTAKVSWSDIADNGEDYWFFWGDDCISHYYGDGDSDYIDIRYTPKKTAAGKGKEKRK